MAEIHANLTFSINENVMKANSMPDQKGQWCAPYKHYKKFRGWSDSNSRRRGPEGCEIKSYLQLACHRRARPGGGRQAMGNYFAVGRRMTLSVVGKSEGTG